MRSAVTTTSVLLYFRGLGGLRAPGILLLFVEQIVSELAEESGTGRNTLYHNSLGVCSLALICLSVQGGKGCS